ncbi:MAG: shikimate kinase [Gammaproteobacteria bacterium]|jgi:shikimate kinase
MQQEPRIFLIGPMGAGKTSIGRQLARLAAIPFHDTDLYIQQRTGVDIPLIFDIEGEAGFRRRETDALKHLSAESRWIIATGGGAVLAEANRRLMQERGHIVYLRAGVDAQMRRTRRGRHRPLLETEDPAGRLRELFEDRDPLYGELADTIVETDRRNVREVAREIARRLKLFAEGDLS